MERAAVYGVSEFVADARGIMQVEGGEVDRPAVVRRLQPLLERALDGPGWTDECYRGVDSEGRALFTYYVDPAERLLVYGVIFRRGRPTPVHDHVTWGLIGVYSGEQRTTRYYRRDDGSVRGRCQVELMADDVLRHGATYPLLPPHDIHRIEVLQPDEGLSIHVLGADLKRQRRRIFDVRLGSCREVEGLTMPR
jgi:3-mercaptopropionate dioxygenase